MDIGIVLRKARERKNLTLADAEDGTKIMSKYLAAMEQEKFTEVPAGIYGSGFIRIYARFLEIDADELVARYREATGSWPAPPEDEEVPRAKVRPARRIWYYAALAVFAGLVIVSALGSGLFSR
ncbi:MAG: helix-turn-helix domain-containing protein [Peptococcaceae bacterium]|nr:helix-turn-helix domain-containing protein [Peptococcaceae bacterium]